jgi:transcriptional regulator with XRE-family HTH domain
MKIDNKILINFGLRVKETRKNRGLSQEELAHKSNLHRTYIGMIERAEKNITLINIEKLSKALDTPLSKLLEDL